MIFGIGLPRSGGQTLAQVLRTLTDQVIWHSITGKDWDVLKSDHRGAVEVYAPYEWLERKWPNSLFIANYRDPDSWLQSCHKMYDKSQELNYNHPLWEYPPDSWLDYYNEYWSNVEHTFPENRLLWWNIIEDPSWGSVCSFLDVPVPDVPFPNKDAHGRGYTIIDEDVPWPSPW